MTEHVLIIAEAGVNHNGDIALARDLIDAAVDAGADVVKFQTFVPEEVVSRFARKAEYQQRTTGRQESQLDMVRRLALPPAAFRDLAAHARTRGITFLSTPFDLLSLALLVDLALDTLKIASGEITNAPLLLAASRSDRKIILSTGMSTLDDVQAALGVLAAGYLGVAPSLQAFSAAFASTEGRRVLAEKVRLLHCTTEYPSPYAEANLRAMDTLRETFGLPVGLSDHTAGITIPIAATARGAVIIEKHFTLDRSLPGPDHAASLTPGELRAMVDAIRQVEAALGDGRKIPTNSELKNIPVARRSIVARRTIAAGTAMTPRRRHFPDAVLGNRRNTSAAGLRARRADRLRAGSAVTWVIIPATDRTRWHQALDAVGCADPYFSAAYHDAYSYDRAVSLMYMHEAGGDRLVYPFRLCPIDRIGPERLAAPTYDIETVYGYTGPVATSAEPGFLAAAWAGFAEWAAANAVVSEFCRFHPLMDNHRFAATDMTVVDDRDIVVVALARGADALWADYSSAQRNLARKASRLGVEVRALPYETGWPLLREIYEGTMADLDADAFYHFPVDYYERLTDMRPAPVIWAAFKDGAACAAALFLVGDRALHYHLSGLRPEGRPYSPNHLLLHAAAEWGITQGLAQFNLGGGRSNDNDDDLLRFKKQFSRATARFRLGRRIWDEARYAELSQIWSRHGGHAPSTRLQHYKIQVPRA